jgi:hypothetical protein
MRYNYFIILALHIVALFEFAVSVNVTPGMVGILAPSPPPVPSALSPAAGAAIGIVISILSIAAFVTLLIYTLKRIRRRNGNNNKRVAE